MPTGSPSGPVAAACFNAAAPTIASSDHSRNPGPGRSPKAGTASTPTTTGATVFINVTSTTDVARSAVTNMSWWTANIRPQPSAHVQPRRVVPSWVARRWTAVATSSTPTPNHNRQNENATPERESAAAIITGPVEKMATPTPTTPTGYRRGSDHRPPLASGASAAEAIPRGYGDGRVDTIAIAATPSRVAATSRIADGERMNPWWSDSTDRG